MRVVDSLQEATELLRAERDENVCGKDMTMSEKLSLGQTLEEEEPKAEERRLEGKSRGGAGGSRGSQEPRL